MRLRVLVFKIRFYRNKKVSRLQVSPAPRFMSFNDVDDLKSSPGVLGSDSMIR